MHVRIRRRRSEGKCRNRGRKDSLASCRCFEGSNDIGFLIRGEEMRFEEEDCLGSFDCRLLEEEGFERMGGCVGSDSVHECIYRERKMCILSGIWSYSFM